MWWPCDLKIHIMIHAPTGKTSSYRKLYRCIPTPMASMENGTHFLANPAEPYLLLDQNDQHPREMTREDMRKCKMVNHYRRYCPATLFLMNQAPPTCLTSLYEGSVARVLEKYPVFCLTKTSFSRTLIWGVYGIFSRWPQECFARTSLRGLWSRWICPGLVSAGLRGGSWQLRVRAICGFLRPGLPTGCHSFVPVRGVERNPSWCTGLRSNSRWITLLQNANFGPGMTMAEVSQGWTQEKLKEHRHWTWQGALLAVGLSMFALIICCCCTRECWNAYQRHQQRGALGYTIQTEVSHDMKDLLQKSTTEPSAPAQNNPRNRAGASA